MLIWLFREVPSYGSFQKGEPWRQSADTLEVGGGEGLSDVQEEIMSPEIVNGIPDIGRERDFVDRAPPGFIRKSVLERYNEFRPKRREDTSADGPPKYEPPDDAA